MKSIVEEVLAMALDCTIDADLIEDFERDGVVVMRGVIDASWRARLRAAIDRDIADPGPFVHRYGAGDGKGRFHGNLRIWENDPNFRAICLESHLPGLAAKIFGGRKVNLLYDQLFVKEPGTPNRTRWHNDQPYWAMRGWQVLSFWLALDPVTKESGAMEFIRGSHKWNRWFQPEKFGATDANSGYERNPDYEKIPDIEATRQDYDIATWDLEAGDAYVFHGLTVHGAGGNLHRDRRRRGYTVRYTGDDVTYDTRPGPNEHLKYALLADGAPLDSERFPVAWRAS